MWGSRRHFVVNTRHLLEKARVIRSPFLTQVGALAVSGQREDENPHDGELTFLGRVLAQLPVSQQLGKLIVLGHVFGCLDECLIIGEPRGAPRAHPAPCRTWRCRPFSRLNALVFFCCSGSSVLEELFCDAF